MPRRKYQFKDRLEAEQAYQKEELRARRMQWFAIALVQKRVRWTRRNGPYRFGVFLPVPGNPHTYPLIVEEFAPKGQLPCYHVRTVEEQREQEGTVIRHRAGEDGNRWLNACIAAYELHRQEVRQLESA